VAGEFSISPTHPIALVPIVMEVIRCWIHLPVLSLLAGLSKWKRSRLAKSLARMFDGEAALSRYIYLRCWWRTGTSRAMKGSSMTPILSPMRRMMSILQC
jgi:hypothetical protein